MCSRHDDHLRRGKLAIFDPERVTQDDLDWPKEHVFHDAPEEPLYTSWKKMFFYVQKKCFAVLFSRCSEVLEKAVLKTKN